MQYKYCQQDNYEDLSCGRVIIHKTGYPNFPVRLAQEIFFRCLNHLQSKANITLYDPCCGGGYLLTVLGLLNTNILSNVIGSDISADAIRLANDNLTLLSAEGLDKRKKHLELLLQKHGDKYISTIKSTDNLFHYLTNTNISTQVFIADVFEKNDFEKQAFKADIVMTDVPYGRLTSWQNNESSNLSLLLNNITPVLKRDSVVAICSDKSQKIRNDNFIKLEKQQIGKRKFEILKLRGN